MLPFLNGRLASLRRVLLRAMKAAVAAGRQRDDGQSRPDLSARDDDHAAKGRQQTLVRQLRAWCCQGIRVRAVRTRVGGRIAPLTASPQRTQGISRLPMALTAKFRANDTRRGDMGWRYAAGAADASSGAGAARLDRLFFAAAGLVATFLVAGLTCARCELDAFLADATTFLAADFAALLTFPAFAETFLAVAGALAGELTSLLFSTRKASRFFALAIQPGARPTPDHVFPVFGSAYFATEATFAEVFFSARLAGTV